MKILAWDTSSKMGSVALAEYEEGQAPKLISEFVLSVDAAQHSEGLLWGIQQVLKSSRLELNQVDRLVVGVGPGSFTGLRVGITVARTLAQVCEIPVTPVSSLVALARPVAEVLGIQKLSPLILTLMDAAKGEWFVLMGRANSILDSVVMADGDMPGLWKRGVEEAVLTPEDLLKLLKKKYHLGKSQFPEFVVLGEVTQRYPDFLKNFPISKRIQPVDLFINQISGRTLIKLGIQAIQAGIERPALSISPRYLREADAERKLKAGLLRSAPVQGS
jgi:tRNA threonylcarbamoyl adenosine modification protein YeaZ